jgi:hypothetical protein
VVGGGCSTPRNVRTLLLSGEKQAPPATRARRTEVVRSERVARLEPDACFHVRLSRKGVCCWLGAAG